MSSSTPTETVEVHAEPVPVTKTKKVKKDKKEKKVKKVKLVKRIKSEHSDETKKTPPTPHTVEEQYISTFTDKERKAYEIAQHHLESSFSLTKSLGFQKWKTSQ